MNGRVSQSLARPAAGRATIAIIAALTAGVVLPVSGQDGREWRDYAGGPDSSRFVAATQITKSNRFWKARLDA